MKQLRCFIMMSDTNTDSLFLIGWTQQVDVPDHEIQVN